MSIKPLAKIDRFYPILFLVIVGLTILIIYTFNGLFKAFNTASDFDSAPGGSSKRVDKAKLDEVFQKLKNRQIPTINTTP